MGGPPRWHCRGRWQGRADAGAPAMRGKKHVDFLKLPLLPITMAAQKAAQKKLGLVLPFTLTEAYSSAVLAECHRIAAAWLRSSRPIPIPERRFIADLLEGKFYRKRGSPGDWWNAIRITYAAVFVEVRRAELRNGG